MSIITNLSFGGSGTGAKNYLQSSASTATGWTASDSNITVSTTNTAADLPRLSTGSGVKFTGVAGSSSYAYARFTVDASDYGKKLQIQFAMNALLGAAVGYVSGDFKIDVYSNTLANYTGTSTRLSLTPTDGTSALSPLPNSESVYATTFDVPNATAPYIEVRIGLNSSNTHSIILSDIVVGPGILTQVPAVSDWQNYTPTYQGFGTVTTNVAQWRRIGSSVEIRGQFITGTVTGANALIGLPAGLTAVTQTTVCEVGTLVSDTASNNSPYTLFTGTAGFLTSMGIGRLQGALTPISGGAFVTPSTLSFQAAIPVNEYVGSTTNVVQNDVEYAYNSSGITTAGASDTTTFAYGPSGAAFGAIASTTPSGNSHTALRVRFRSPIQVTDQKVLETDLGTGGLRWVSFADSAIASVIQGGAEYGAHLADVNATDVDVLFGNGGATAGTTYAANGNSTWNNISTWRWRVKKFSGGQAVGFGAVVPGVSAGLVPAAGLPGQTNGSAIAAGNVGEVKTVSRVRSTAVALTNNTAQNVTASPLVLGAGTYLFTGAVAYLPSGTTQVGTIIGLVSLTSAGFPATDARAVPTTGGEYYGIEGNATTTPVNDLIMQIPSYPVTLNTTTTFYLVSYATFNTSILSTYGFLSAVRIA